MKMKMLTILQWIKNHWQIAAKAVLSLSAGFILLFGISTYKQNKKLSEQLNIAQNNIEAYQDALNGSQQASNVLKVDLAKYKQTNDSLLRNVVDVAKKYDIKPKEIRTAATQKQSIDVTSSKGVGGDIITILKDTTYQDSIEYNNLTKVFYTIGKDTINIRLKLDNTQYLYVYSKKEYKNKKNFFQRLFTLDWKKVKRYKYKIVNTNDLLKTDSVRVIENIDLK